MTNYPSHNPRQFEPRQFEQQRERGPQRPQGRSGNFGQYEEDPYDQQQQARYAWNNDPDYREFENRDYGGEFEQQGYRGGSEQQNYGRQNFGQQFAGEEQSYQRERYAPRGEGFSSSSQRYGQAGRSTWAQGSEGSRSQGNYPDYEAMMPRGYQGSNIGRQWENQQRGGQGGGQQESGRVSFANRWPSSGYQTQQSGGANPSWQNNPSRSSEDYGRGAYGLPFDQPTDYSLGSDVGARGGYGYNLGHRGRGPKGYERSDERVREDICERLAEDPQIDASDITVTVKAGTVTLEGTIDERSQKHRAEDIADSCIGVKDVQNRLNVSPRGQRELSTSQQQSGNKGQKSMEAGESQSETQQKQTRQ